MEKESIMPIVKPPQKKSNIEEGENKMKKVALLTAEEAIAELKKHPTETPYNRRELLTQLGTFVILEDSPNFSVEAKQYLEDNKNYPDVASLLRAINFRPVK